MKIYHLYCGDNSFIIGEELPEYFADYQQIEYSDNLIKDLWEGVLTGNFYIKCNAETMLQFLKTKFKYIEAAGGYVLNNLGMSLVILRNGLWDLPKGKVELGENTATAAIREVQEETGIPNPQIVEKLLDTYHFYRWGSDPTIVLKKTYWYKMIHEGTPTTKPQTEEGISSCMWVDDSKINQMMAKTHRNLKILFQLKKEGKI